MDVDPWINHIYKYCRKLTYSRSDEDYRDLAHNVILKLLNVDRFKVVNDAYIHSVCANTWRDMLTVHAVKVMYISNMNVDNIVPMTFMVYPEAEANIQAKQLGLNLDNWKEDAKQFISSLKKRVNARASSKNSYADPVKRELKKKAALEYYYRKKNANRGTA